MKRYFYTTVKDLRVAFRREMIELEGLEKWKAMSLTTKRCIFLDWVDSLQKNGDISEALSLRSYWK